MWLLDLGNVFSLPFIILCSRFLTFSYDWACRILNRIKLMILFYGNQLACLKYSMQWSKQMWLPFRMSLHLYCRFWRSDLFWVMVLSLDFNKHKFNLIWFHFLRQGTIIVMLENCKYEYTTNCSLIIISIPKIPDVGDRFTGQGIEYLWCESV